VCEPVYWEGEEMIPFEVEPLIYMFFVGLLITSVLLVYFGYTCPTMKEFFYIFSVVFAISCIGIGVVIYTGSIEQVDIVVCNHVAESYSMYLVGDNQQTYMISDSGLKLKIRDGAKIHVAVLNEWGYAYPKIYKIDAPFVCGDGC
jgi:hypothetical protein